MLEEPTAYYKKQLAAATRLQSSNKGIVTLDILANKPVFDSLVKNLVRIKRITIPLSDGKHLIYITTEIPSDHERIINGVKKLRL